MLKRTITTTTHLQRAVSSASICSWYVEPSVRIRRHRIENNPNGVFTLSENDFGSETDEMVKSSQSHWEFLAILSVSLQKSFSVSLSVNTP